MSTQKLRAAIFLQKKPIMQVLVAKNLFGIPIAKIVCECFCRDKKNRSQTEKNIVVCFLPCNWKHFTSMFDSHRKLDDIAIFIVPELLVQFRLSSLVSIKL